MHVNSERKAQTMPRHTKTPWTFEGMALIEQPTRKRLMVLSSSLGSEGIMEHEANAAHIVHCVNVHEELVHLLSDAFDKLDKRTMEENFPGWYERTRLVLESEYNNSPVSRS